MILTALTGMTIFLAILIFFCLYRAFIGPTAADRVVSINIIATKVTVLIALITIVTDQDAFVDVALIYAMMGFIATICVSKYVEKGKLF
ncbi:multiple resistance and pH regulation protein F [Alkaliphilus metalliredigens QYMF]|uniref:Multiple resistance and pH regulation protein F n=1 Tax=Alkaliphilus metalliredigens (strain QYMF) TaxID=293826 RepID=A6TVM1_ALKMQ|nr:monovalent cation/H+ antiporter complex subunit F [Alkaliphilus metalliredigens]ABR50239.1 multiple resistance and pH regulation protein F [Alkaliphilus metalliredigens QYMF]